MALNIWHDISPGKNVPSTFNVIIEITKGSRNKFELDKETGLIKLDRVLFSPFYYPFDYGFVPQTYWEDGDPLDVMVLVHEPTIPGCLVEVRPVGMMEMIDGGESDTKILAVPVGDPRFDHIKDVTDNGQHILKEIQHLFERYKDLQGKTVEVKGWKSKKEAEKCILEGVKLYKEKFKDRVKT